MLAPQKVPTTITFVDSLPVNASGKVQKFVLVDRWAEEHSGHLPSNAAHDGSTK